MFKVCKKLKETKNELKTMEHGVFWEYSIQYQRMLEVARKNPKGRSNTGESE